MIFDRFFKPYAEYCLRTTLSEDELKTALEKEFPWYGFLSGFKTAMSLAALEDKVKVVFFKTGRPLILHPVKIGRNSLRGEVHIHCRKPETAGETVLDITIAPRNDRWLGWGISGFCIMASLIFCFGMWQGIIPLLMAGFLVVNLAASRLFAEKEIPVIQNVFEITLRQLEKKYKDKNQGDDHE